MKSAAESNADRSRTRIGTIRCNRRGPRSDSDASHLRALFRICTLISTSSALAAASPLPPLPLLLLRAPPPLDPSLSPAVLGLLDMCCCRLAMLSTIRFTTTSSGMRSPRSRAARAAAPSRTMRRSIVSSSSPMSSCCCRRRRLPMPLAAQRQNQSKTKQGTNPPKEETVDPGRHRRRRPPPPLFFNRTLLGAEPCSPVASSLALASPAWALIADRTISSTVSTLSPAAPASRAETVVLPANGMPVMQTRNGSSGIGGTCRRRVQQGVG